jgi:hypothetical protein
VSGSRATCRGQAAGELVGIDCFFVGRLSGTKGSVWQLTAIDVASSFAWAELVSCPHGHPTGVQTSKLARSVCGDLAQAGWRLERMLSDNGGEFRSAEFPLHAGRARRPPHPDPRRQAADQRRRRSAAPPDLEECWRPAFARYLHVRFTGLKRDLNQYLDEYNFRRVHNGRLTRGRIPADIVYGANKVKTR